MTRTNTDHHSDTQAERAADQQLNRTRKLRARTLALLEDLRQHINVDAFGDDFEAYDQLVEETAQELLNISRPPALVAGDWELYWRLPTLLAHHGVSVRHLHLETTAVAEEAGLTGPASRTLYAWASDSEPLPRSLDMQAVLLLLTALERLTGERLDPTELLAIERIEGA
ncbi:MAG: hypothetical protein OXH85_09375 [Truepera sp.]|nr:hypothetical protein [Truepera sp.]